MHQRFLSCCWNIDWTNRIRGCSWIDRFVMLISIRQKLKLLLLMNQITFKCSTHFKYVNCWYLDFTYTREKAAYPLEYVADNKFWPSVRRVDETYGDRNLVCSCAPIEHTCKTKTIWKMPRDIRGIFLIQFKQVHNLSEKKIKSKISTNKHFKKIKYYIFIKNHQYFS
jgi:hypothetical protein